MNYINQHIKNRTVFESYNTAQPQRTTAKVEQSLETLQIKPDQWSGNELL